MIIGMTTHAQLIRGVARWPGILDTDHLMLDPVVFGLGQQLANAARKGSWPEVFMLLDDDPLRVLPYQWRPGGTKWSTVLHQAAWHGAPKSVVDKLIKRGAVRWLPDAAGRLPVDVANERGHAHLLEPLTPPKPALDLYRLHQLDMRLAELVFDHPVTQIDGPDDVKELAEHNNFRLPPVQILQEFRKQQMWFPMMGGDMDLRVTLHRGYLEVLTWSALNPKFVGPVGVTLVTTEEIVHVEV